MFGSHASRQLASTTFTLLVAVSLPVRAQGSPTWIWPGGGHEGIPYARLTPDRQTLVSGATYDETTKVWRAADGRLQRTLVHGVGEVRAVAVSPDGTLAATAGELVFGSGDSPVYLWRLADGALLRQLTGSPDNQANAVAFSPDGTLVAAGESSQVFIWRVSDGQLVRTLTGHTGDVFSVAWSPNGTWIATGSGDTKAKIWDAATGALVRTLSGHTFFVSGVAWSPDSARLATSSWDKTSRIWNVSTGAILKTFTDSDALYCVDWSSTGTLVATGGTTRALHLYNPNTGALVRDVTDPGMADVFSAAFASDGASVVSGSSDGHPRQFDVASGALVRQFGVHAAQIDSVAYAPDGSQLASSGPDMTVRVWNAGNGTLVRSLLGHQDEVGQVTFSPDGTLIASCAGHLGPDASADHSIRLWKASDGSLVRTLAGHGKMTWRIAFSPDGTTLASGGQEGATNSLRFWRVSDGALLHTIDNLPDTPRRVVYTPDGAFLLAAVATEVRYYRPTDFTLAKSVATGANTEWIALDRDGVRMATAHSAYGANVKLWRVADGAPLWTAAGHPDGFAQAVDIAPDGRTVVSASGFARDIRIWRATDGSLLQTYDRETGWGQEPRLPVALDPVGARLGYGRTDATVIVAHYPFGPDVLLSVGRNAALHAVHLSWTGGTGPYTLRRALDPRFTSGVTTLVDHQAVTSFDDPVLDDGVDYYYDVSG